MAGKEQRLDANIGLSPVGDGDRPAGEERSDLSNLAVEAFIYGFPIVFEVQEVKRFLLEGMGSVPPAALNSFGHGAALMGPKDTFVSINNDTVYSIAQVDLSGGPVHLQVPDAAGRYYVLQFVDAWTNNFAYVGRRATGTGSGSYLLVSPDWDGSAQGEEIVIRFPTTLASIIGRWAVNGDDDMALVGDLQAQLILTPTGDVSGNGMPMPATSVSEELLFFEQLRVWMRAFPPAAHDLEYQRRFAPLGVFDLSSPFADPNPELATALSDGLAAGKKQIEDDLSQREGPAVNGWKLTYHAFDYNRDFFEIGTLDDPSWKIADPQLRYLERARAARGGLWGNHGYEAAYAMVYEDREGGLLNGANRYELRFQAAPPVNAFWSVTMYGVPDFYLVDNPIDRYSIGDRTPDLSYGDDGSLTIFMQRDEPQTPEARANWLPTPAGAFRPLMRMYEPKVAILDGSYELPGIERLP